MSVELFVLVLIAAALMVVLFLATRTARRSRRIDKPFKIHLIQSLNRPDERALNWDMLTEREMEIVQMLVDGKSNVEIANALVISRRTVDTHIGNIYDKLGIHNRYELIRAGREHLL